jgi:hypothetical protein
MPPRTPRTTTAYIVIEDFGRQGRAFRETELAEADLGTIVRNMISGEYRNPMRVIAFNTERRRAINLRLAPMPERHLTFSSSTGDDWRGRCA